MGASQTMLDRAEKRVGIRPDWLGADTAWSDRPSQPNRASTGSAFGTNHPRRRCSDHLAVNEGKVFVEIGQ